MFQPHTFKRVPSTKLRQWERLMREHVGLRSFRAREDGNGDGCTETTSMCNYHGDDDCDCV